MVRLIVVLFFVSGATALMGEVVWMRMLGLVLGNTVWAASTAVAVWMAGMALGAHVGGRLAPRTTKHLRWYGLAEATIGAFFVASVPLHGVLLGLGTKLGPDLGGALALGIAHRLALAAVALAVPTVLMGVTLPLLVERVRAAGLASRVSLLYGINTLGATAGVFVAAYAALPSLGERGTLAAAALACGVVGCAAILFEGHVPAARAVPRAPDVERTTSRYLLLVGTMGMSALAAELVWVRVLVLHLGSRVYAFALLLGVYLLGIALGSLLLWAVSERIRDPVKALARLQMLVAVVIVVQVLGLGHFGGLLGVMPQFVHLTASFAAVQGMLLVAVAVVFLPVTALFGASFPLAVAASPGRRSAGSVTGEVAAANTVGGILGALAAPFLLVPTIGCQRTLLLLAMVHVVVAVFLLPRRALVGSAVAVAVVAVVLSLALPGDWILRRAEGDRPDTEIELVSLQESVSATVLVKRYREQAGTWMSLELNGVNVAGSEPALLAVQQLQGQVPLLQVAAPRRVLHVGFGSGGTCWAVSCHPVERIDVVEISPEVVEAADTYFPDINRHVLDDDRVRVVINDGRNYLLATDASYDAILSDSIHPVYAGNSTLYTVEYFRMCRDHLNPGGVVSMWLPLYSLDQESYLRILSAFAEVFPHTVVWYDVSTVNEYSVVTGKVEAGPVSVAWERMDDRSVAQSLAIAGVHNPEDLAANLLLGPREVAALVAEVEPHSDDLPFVEYTAGRIVARERTWFDNLLLLTTMRARANPFADERVPWAAAVERRDAALYEILRTVRDMIGGDEG